MLFIFTIDNIQKIFLKIQRIWPSEEATWVCHHVLPNFLNTGTD